MFRAVRASLSVDAGWRLMAPLLVLALVWSVEAGNAPVAAAQSPGSVASIRSRQLTAEKDMRRADKQIDRLRAQRTQHTARLKAAKRKLTRAIDRRKAADHKTGRRAERLDLLELELARAVRVHPDPRGAQTIDRPGLRKQIRKLDHKVARLERNLHKAEKRVDSARKLKQHRATKVGKARVDARKAERERSEDKLSGAITQMLELSGERASSAFRTASSTRFVRPAAGTISQSYGCTGYRLNPRRGSCRHFHDGIDIAAPRGTRVRASADGFVAYVGFNPWDGDRRSFIVIVGHARGYETVYAHLKPVRKVRAGQRIEQGDLIGIVGTTGRTTGPHVHWEVKQSSVAVHPLRAGR